MSLLLRGLGVSQNKNGFWACAHCAAQPAHQGHTRVVGVDGLGTSFGTGTAWLLRPTLRGCLPAPRNSTEKRTAEGKTGVMSRGLLLVFLHFPASFPYFL